MAGLINTAQTTAAPDYNAQVQSLYGTDLNRTGEQAGVDYYTNQLKNGTSMDDVNKEFLASPEYAALHAPKAPTATPDYTPAPAAAVPAVAQGYTAAQQAPAVSSSITQRTVDPATETVNGQVQGIINQNSPLMQQAQAQALQRANDRGLGDSSLAVGAAQGAVLSAATPIANADAGVYGNAANMNTTTQNQFTAQRDATQNQINNNNVTSTNQASAFTSDAGNKASMQNASLGTQAALSSADNSVKFATAQLSAQTQLALGNLDSTTKMSLNTLDAQNKQLLQTNTSASNLFNQTVTNLANIASSSTMDAAAKQAATDNQMTLLHQGMTAISATASTAPAAIANLNLGQYFTQAATTPPPSTTPATPAVAASNQTVPYEDGRY